MSDNQSVGNLVRCDRCQSWWPSHEAMIQHKKEMKNANNGHVFCEHCEQNFYNKETLEIHIANVHPAENNLACPGCNSPFTLVSSLMSHLENNRCRYIPADTIEANRVRKLLFAEDLKNAGTTARLNLSKYLAPVDGDNNGSAQDDEAPGRPFIDLGIANPVYFSPSIFQEVKQAKRNRSMTMFTGNALADAVAASPNSPSPPHSQRSVESGMTAESATPTPEGKALAKILFPDAETAAPAELASASTSNAGAKYYSSSSNNNNSNSNSNSNSSSSSGMINNDPTNPDSPCFNPAACYNSLLRKYKCPKRMCGKSFPTTNGLLKHLRSLAHNTTGPRLQCPHCLRCFDSANALTQHSESQGKRCRIRETENFRMYMDQLTGGVADVDGQHPDHTVRYKVSEDAVAKFTGEGAIETLKEGAKAMERVRQAVEAEQARRGFENKEAYWKGKKLYW